MIINLNLVILYFIINYQRKQGFKCTILNLSFDSAMITFILHCCQICSGVTEKSQKGLRRAVRGGQRRTCKLKRDRLTKVLHHAGYYLSCVYLSVA